MSQINPSTEPFLLPGSRIGCLLIHGFTGSPKEMRGMGEYLNQRGYSCLGIRLHGHATEPEDMLRSRWNDWTASVEDGFHQLSGITDRIYLIGLSMGGALALLMSTRLDVSGVIAMATPHQLPTDYPIWLLRLYGRFVRFSKKAGGIPGNSWRDKAAYVDHFSYPQNPILAVAELKLLLNEMQAQLQSVHVPVLLMHSHDDNYVLPENMEQIYAGLINASDKTKIYITESSHVVTRDAAQNQVFESALNFIRSIENQKITVRELE